MRDTPFQKCASTDAGAQFGVVCGPQRKRDDAMIGQGVSFRAGEQASVRRASDPVGGLLLQKRVANSSLAAMCGRGAKEESDTWQPSIVDGCNAQTGPKPLQSRRDRQTCQSRERMHRRMRFLDSMLCQYVCQLMHIDIG